VHRSHVRLLLPEVTTLLVPHARMQAREFAIRAPLIADLIALLHESSTRDWSRSSEGRGDGGALAVHEGHTCGTARPSSALSRPVSARGREREGLGGASRAGGGVDSARSDPAAAYALLGQLKQLSASSDEIVSIAGEGWDSWQACDAKGADADDDAGDDDDDDDGTAADWSAPPPRGRRSEAARGRPRAGDAPAAARHTTMYVLSASRMRRKRLEKGGSAAHANNTDRDASARPPDDVLSCAPFEVWATEEAASTPPGAARLIERSFEGGGGGGAKVGRGRRGSRLTAARRAQTVDENDI